MRWKISDVKTTPYGDKVLWSGPRESSCANGVHLNVIYQQPALEEKDGNDNILCTSRLAATSSDRSNHYRGKIS